MEGEQPVAHIPAPPPKAERPATAGELPSLPLAGIGSRPGSGDRTSAELQAYRASSARKKLFPTENSMFRPSTPQHKPLLIPHKRIFKERDSEEIFSARSRGEQRRLKDHLLLSHKLGAFGNATGVVDEWAELDGPATSMAFLSNTGWRPSGGKQAPVPDVIDIEEAKKRHKEAEAARKRKAAGEDEPPAAPPVDAEKTTHRLAEEDLQKRQKNKDKRMDKMLKATEMTHKPKINRKEGEEPRAPDGGENVTKRLTDDVERRTRGRENALQKVLKKQDAENRKKDPDPIGDMGGFVDRMYVQQTQHREQRKKHMLNKYCKTPAAKKMTAEEQKANSARLYGEGRERTRNAMEKFHKMYIGDRTTKYAKMSEAERDETTSRLSQKKMNT